MRVYLDNCCYNRPYDDQSQIRISLETQAKLYVQEMIRDGKLELASSYVLMYENSKNPYEIKKRSIAKFLEENTSVYISEEYSEAIEKTAKEIMKTGVKTADSFHVACALFANCDYFLTTDDRILKYRTDRLCIMNPIDFIRQTGGADNDEYQYI